VPKPTTEESRRLRQEVPEGAIEGILTYTQRASWFEATAPQQIGVSGVHHYLSHGKPSGFSLEGLFVFAELEGRVFSKNEIEKMTRSLLDQTSEEMPVVEELLSTGGFEKNALGFVFRPQAPNEEVSEDNIPEWVGGVTLYKQPSDRMIGPELQDLSAHEFGRQFTGGGEVLVFEPSDDRLRQLLAGIDIRTDTDLL
jgi:hypothetical protein